ncbi:hypothetical protein BKA00_007442 [Actinomadura coerulea]|uniref:Uncharacterized protein n=1 Tax=Actinomadura coerulea TaxID=46159 RepID=A0A7X0G6V7_9ACTN|nr:hypothetical protein [Actinomadura coerulea]MBB6400528.1 hypothetical protein [Actinomadura coerulea]GGQ07869.1 hypothetical protein GCM10010187_24950 [Actinomadura coerulea]
MTYALLVWLVIGAISSAVTTVRTSEPAKSAGFLVNAATNAGFAAYVAVVWL